MAVPDGDLVIPVLNQYIESFAAKDLPIFASRDWHPAKHCSFKDQGGPWPPHCVQNSEGAQLAQHLRLTETVSIISKGTRADRDAYSAFQETELNDRLQQHHTRRLFVGGLATDYCVLNTVKDALELGYEVWLLEKAMRAVNVNPDDGAEAIDAMVRKGANFYSGEVP